MRKKRRAGVFPAFSSMFLEMLHLTFVTAGCKKRKRKV